MQLKGFSHQSFTTTIRKKKIKLKCSNILLKFAHLTLKIGDQSKLELISASTSLEVFEAKTPKIFTF